MSTHEVSSSGRKMLVYDHVEQFLGAGHDPCLVRLSQELSPRVTSYPLAYTIRSVFGRDPNPMTDLSYMLHQYSNLVPNMRLLGTFVDNHDIDRYRRINPDLQAARSALTYVFFSMGLPIVYYGTGQSTALE